MQISCRDKNRIAIQATSWAARDGCLQHVVPDGRRGPGGRSSAGETGVDLDCVSLLEIARNLPMSTGSKADARSPTPARILRRGGKSSGLPHAGGRSAWPRKSPPELNSFKPSIVRLAVLRAFMQHVENSASSAKYSSWRASPLRSRKRPSGCASTYRMHVPTAPSRASGAQDQAREGRNICIELIQQIRDFPASAGAPHGLSQEESVAEIVDRSGVLQGRAPWYPGATPPSIQRTANDRHRRQFRTKEVVIGFDRPFVIIANDQSDRSQNSRRRNGGGRFSRVEADARAQVEAGAHMLDVNAGIRSPMNRRSSRAPLQLVQSITDVPLSIDSSIVARSKPASRCTGQALVNSVTAKTNDWNRCCRSSRNTALR